VIPGVPALPARAPRTEAELLDRAMELAGRPLAWVAARRGLPVPDDLRRQKGWIGQLLEGELGATSGSKAEPDFPHLGVEMKTLPVDGRGRPRESTYVCTAPLDGSMPRAWRESWVCRKLSRVLWVPILTEADAAPGERTVCTPFLWSPSEDEQRALEADWKELSDLVALGEVWQLTGRHGKVLQLRPKAARASERTWLLDDEGSWVRDTKRGFYLRPAFTAAVLAARLRLPG
jgi:DNA mismatch repair protein MutH